MVYGDSIIYVRIDWENYPSDKTPVNERNLNKMDLAIHLLDERVVWLNENKFDKTESFKLVKNIDLDEETGIFTITYYDNTFKKIDTILEKVATNWDYDSVSQQLVITLDDGTVKRVDLSALITQYEFMASETVSFEVQPDGKVKAVVREGSIQEKHLRPNYLAEIKLEQGKAQQSAADAEVYAKLSESYAHGGTGVREGEGFDNAMEYARQAKESADRASEVVSGSDLAELINVVGSTNIENIGDGTVTGAIKDLDGREFKIIRLNGIDSGIASTWELPTLSVALTYHGVSVDDLPVENADGSPDRWIIVTAGVDGGNRMQLAATLYGTRMFYRTIWNEGSQIYGVWHELLAGVKGNAEGEYRSGYVNITPANIGLGNVNNTSDSNKDVNSAKQLSGWADTRNDPTTPDAYNAKLLPVGIKTPAASGITVGWSYATLVGIRGWTDKSGGKAHELGFDGGGKLFHRVGLDTTWEAWREIAHMDNIPTKASDINAANSSDVGVNTSNGVKNIMYSYPSGKSMVGVGGVASLNTAIKESTQKISEAVVNLGTVYCSPGKVFYPPSGGKWYRLGHVEKDATFYGEFILSHSWSNNPAEAVKFIVGGACSGVKERSFNVQKIFVSYTGSNVMVKKARVVYYPGGTLNYNIYVDVMLEHNPTFFEKDDVWYYRLARKSTFDGKDWVDDNFADATIPSGYASKEASLEETHAMEYPGGNSSRKLTFSGMFSAVISAVGLEVRSQGTFLIQGYGIVTADNPRVHVTTLYSGGDIECYTVEGEEAVVVSNKRAAAHISIFMLYGSLPTVTS